MSSVNTHPHPSFILERGPCNSSMAAEEAAEKETAKREAATKQRLLGLRLANGRSGAVARRVAGAVGMLTSPSRLRACRIGGRSRKESLQSQEGAKEERRAVCRTGAALDHRLQRRKDQSG
ncbi:UNVERIFIED_CONTAM: hypothetical protein K2H54_017901 [Gekko kuhli]